MCLTRDMFQSQHREINKFRKIAQIHLAKLWPNMPMS